MLYCHVILTHCHKLSILLTEVLTLVSNERIPFTATMRMLLEIQAREGIGKKERAALQSKSKVASQLPMLVPPIKALCKQICERTSTLTPNLNIPQVRT